jgi:hypothetical protein
VKVIPVRMLHLALDSISSGQANTAVGYNAGHTPGYTVDLTGVSNTFLGTRTGLSSGTLNNATAIGAYAQAAYCLK